MTSNSTICATMMISGQRYALQNSAIALLRGFRARAARERRALRHDGGCARDRVGEIEVGNGRAERRLLGRAAARGEFLDVGRATRRDLIDAREMRMCLEQRSAELAQRGVR